MKCTLCSSEERVDDRGAYPVCESCHAEQKECSERLKNGDMLDRDCGELCMQCGLCCTVLSAEATSEEVEHLASWSGRLPTEVAMVEKDPYPSSGKLVLKRPCVFLVGKPTEYVRCQAYSTKRPIVCEEYLCRIAIRYQAGLCTLHEALFILKASITRRGSVSNFNWSAENPKRDSKDHRLANLLATKRALAALESESNIGYAQLMLFHRMHSHFDFDTDLQETIFAAIVSNFDNKSLELDQFFSDEVIEGFDDRDKEVALKTIYQVVGDFKGFFRVVD